MGKKDRQKIGRSVLAAAIFVLAAGAAIVGGITIKKRVKAIRGESVDSKNLLVNPGFEEGKVGWHWLHWSKGWAPFQISRDKSRSGDFSALLPVRSEGESRSTIVWGVVQEALVGSDPIDCLEGYYYVDRWERGAKSQYIQAVIIDLSRKLDSGNPQIRYILSGMDHPPYNLGNARYVFLDRERRKSPPQKKWVRFNADPAADFKTFWGYRPSRQHRLRVLFEARFDARSATSPQAMANVYYDDLFLGSKVSGRCRGD